MPFIVRTMERRGPVGWLRRADGYGTRAIVRRPEHAERFRTELEAFTAASAMPGVQEMRTFFRVDAIEDVHPHLP